MNEDVEQWELARVLRRETAATCGRRQGKKKNETKPETEEKTWKDATRAGVLYEKASHMVRELVQIA